LFGVLFVSMYGVLLFWLLAWFLSSST